MKYRVILRVSYCEAHFEFDDIEEAGVFAHQILLHSIKSEDTDKNTSVRIDAFLDEEVKPESEDEE